MHVIISPLLFGNFRFTTQHGASPDAEILKLWCRIVFNIKVSNTDYHVRNHGFLYVGGSGWRLSPAYDLNSVPVEIKPRTLSTTITFDSAAVSLELALEVAEEFVLKPNQAMAVVREVCGVVAQRKQTAKQIGINGKVIAKMAWPSNTPISKWPESSNFRFCEKEM